MCSVAQCGHHLQVFKEMNDWAYKSTRTHYKMSNFLSCIDLFTIFFPSIILSMRIFPPRLG